MAYGWALVLNSRLFPVENVQADDPVFTDRSVFLHVPRETHFVCYLASHYFLMEALRAADKFSFVFCTPARNCLALAASERA